MPDTSNLNPQKIARWKVIAAGLRANPEWISSFAGLLEDLEQMIDEAERLQIQQKGVLAQLRLLNRRRSELAGAGEELRIRLTALVQAEHGFKNDKLIEFGVKPRRRARPRKEEQPEPTTLTAS
jgi:hypothetical protein